MLDSKEDTLAVDVVSLALLPMIELSQSVRMQIGSVYPREREATIFTQVSGNRTASPRSP